MNVMLGIFRESSEEIIHAHDQLMDALVADGKIHRLPVASKIQIAPTKAQETISLFCPAGTTCTSAEARAFRPFSFSASETRIGWTLGVGWRQLVSVAFEIGRFCQEPR
jgi:hypothetical protein